MRRLEGALLAEPPQVPVAERERARGPVRRVAGNFRDVVKSLKNCNLDNGNSGVIDDANKLGKRGVVRGLRVPVDEQDLVIGVQCGSPGGQSGLKEGDAVATGDDKGDLRGRERGIGDQREARRRLSAVRPGACVGNIGYIDARMAREEKIDKVLLFYIILN